MRPSVVRRDLPPEVRRMQLWVWVGRVPVPASPRREHHIAPFYAARVHLSEVHCREVDLEGPFITEGLETDVALDALLARRRTHVRNADVVAQFLPDLLLDAVVNVVLLDRRPVHVLLAVVRGGRNCGACGRRRPEGSVGWRGRGGGTRTEGSA